MPLITSLPRCVRCRRASKKSSMFGGSLVQRPAERPTSRCVGPPLIPAAVAAGPPQTGQLLAPGRAPAPLEPSTTLCRGGAEFTEHRDGGFGEVGVLLGGDPAGEGVVEGDGAAFCGGAGCRVSDAACAQRLRDRLG